VKADIPTLMSATIGASLCVFSASVLGEVADRLSLSGVTSAFGEITQKQAFVDGSYVVVVHPQSANTGRAKFTITAAFNKDDVCLSFVLNMQARDADIALSTAFWNSTDDKLKRGCYPADNERGLEALTRLP